MDANYMNTHPGIAESVVRAHIKAVRFIEKNKEEAVRIGARYSGFDERIVERAMGNISYSHGLHGEGVMEYLQFLSEKAYIREIDHDAFVRSFLRAENKE